MKYVVVLVVVKPHAAVCPRSHMPSHILYSAPAQCIAAEPGCNPQGSSKSYHRAGNPVKNNGLHQTKTPRTPNPQKG